MRSGAQFGIRSTSMEKDTLNRFWIRLNQPMPVRFAAGWNSFTWSINASRTFIKPRDFWVINYPIFVAPCPHFGGLLPAIPAMTFGMCIQKGLQRRQGSASRRAGGQPLGNWRMAWRKCWRWSGGHMMPYISIFPLVGETKTYHYFGCEQVFVWFPALLFTLSYLSHNFANQALSL
jgi:hypothetical protein